MPIAALARWPEFGRGAKRLVLFRRVVWARRLRPFEKVKWSPLPEPRPPYKECRYRQPDGRSHICQVHVLQARSRLASPRRRAAGGRQARVPRRLRGFRPRPLAARLLNHRHARRRRPRRPRAEPEPGRPAHLSRRPWPERPGAVGGDALLVPLDDQALALLGGAGPARDLRQRAQVPLPLSDGQAAALVRPAARGAPADHAQPHRGRPPLPGDHDQHQLLVRARRPGVRRRLRGR